MTLSLERSDDFDADFEKQYEWYFTKAGAEVAERFLGAVADTLPLLANQPELGRLRKFGHPLLRNLRSFRVSRPFQSILIFYRVNGNVLQAWRIVHGSRDLPRRLIEPAA